MATLIWDSNSWLLRAKVPSGETVFTWTCPMFEDWTGEAITPTQYGFMTGYIQERTTPADLELMAQGLYHHAAMASAAVDAWNTTSEEDRLEWQQQTIYQLEGALDQAREKETAVVTWILDEESTFGIWMDDDERSEFSRGLLRKYREKTELCERLLAEERAMDLD